MAPLRVLALHGYTQNGFIFSKKIGAIRRAIKDAEITFIDAPHILSPADLPGGDLSQYDAGGASSEAQTPETAPRAWWLHVKKDGQTSYKGFDETVKYLSDVLSKDTYDGVLGFSQGAGLAALLASLVARPSLHPDFTASHPPFKFAITVSGFVSHEPAHKDWYPLPGLETTKILHIIGRNDTLVVPERSEALAKLSPGGRVEYHVGGHFLPSTAAWRRFFHQYISSFSTPDGVQGDVESPVANPSSNPPSNASTPAPSRPWTPERGAEKDAGPDATQKQEEVPKPQL